MHTLLSFVRHFRFWSSFLLICLLTSIQTVSAQGQITDEWKSKSKWIIDTTANGADLKAPLSKFVTPIRLHTGNFDFKTAKPDGSDIRIVAADGKTILPHQVEYFDAPNELAILWVGVATIAPNNREQFVWVFAGNPNASAIAPKAPIYGSETGLALHFSGALENMAGGQVQIDATGTAPEALGVTANALKFAGVTSKLTLTGPGVAVSANGATLNGWIQLATADATGTVMTVSGDQYVVTVSVEKGIPSLIVSGKAGSGKATAAAPIQGVDYALFTLVMGERVALLINGTEAASVSVKVGEQASTVSFGGGAAFNLDEVTMSQVVRNAEWAKATVASQGSESKLIGVESAEGSGEASHFKILIDNLTLDGEIVIYLLVFMFIVALWVMVSKTIQLRKVLSKNAEFLKAFDSAEPTVFTEGTFGATSAGAAAANSRFEASPLYRMFEAAAVEVKKRAKLNPGTDRPIDVRGMNSVRAAIDSTMLGESTKLNKLMVFLTIAISGGPFIGLLGTVVGVMITFAAIAAAGDVNVNAIAPGIAAALLATVAGLAVAIPALFGYNWLISQIKDASNQMAVFADSLQSRIAETYQKS